MFSVLARLAVIPLGPGLKEDMPVFPASPAGRPDRLAGKSLFR
jgi:hypothetical protein